MPPKKQLFIIDEFLSKLPPKASFFCMTPISGSRSLYPGISGCWKPPGSRDFGITGFPVGGPRINIKKNIIAHFGLAPSSHFARVWRMEFLVLNCCDCLDFSNVIFDLRDISGCQDCTCNLPQSLPWSVSNGWIFYICMWELAQDTTFLSGKQGKKNNNDATVFFRRETSTGSRCNVNFHLKWS